MNTYYVADSGQQRGPYSVDQLSGQGVRPETMIWSQSMPAWAPARDVQEVATVLATWWGGGVAPPVPFMAPPPYGQPYPPPTVGGRPGVSDPAQSQAAGNKIAAGICGILLGWLGIHKFILGMTTPGLIMLLVSLFTCVGYPVMLVIGIIEGIIYLTKSDEEFYQTYVLQKKQWF